MYFSLLHSYLVPLRPKYSTQHPILKHPFPTFLSQCERQSFTPVNNNGQNYISVYLKYSVCYHIQRGTRVTHTRL
jgi:hypothetical protein